MNKAILLAMSCWAGVAMAEPTVTNHDGKAYALQLDCKHISHGENINPDSTVSLADFRVASNCQVNIYSPAENPFGKNGDYDPKKRVSTAKVKKDSECVIQKRRLVCQ
jgi:hypothetical protein